MYVSVSMSVFVLGKLFPFDLLCSIRNCRDHKEKLPNDITGSSGDDGIAVKPGIGVGKRERKNENG